MEKITKFMQKLEQKREVEIAAGKDISFYKKYKIILLSGVNTFQILKLRMGGLLKCKEVL